LASLSNACAAPESKTTSGTRHFREFNLSDEKIANLRSKQMSVRQYDSYQRLL